MGPVRWARRRRPAALAALAVLLGLLATGCTSAPGPRPLWREYAPGPVAGGPRFAQAAVWTGREVVVWGGTRRIDPCHETGEGGGAALTPGTGAWRRLPDGPLGPRADPHAHWTGTEVLVIGGSYHGYPCTRTPLTDGAAYRPDPAGGPGTWRSLPPAPLPTGAWVAATAWTGSELLVWAGLDGGAAYRPDPTGGPGTWRSLPPAPPPAAGLPARAQVPTSDVGQVRAHSAWTGREWLVWSSVADVGPARGQYGPSVSWPLAYDPAADRWRPVADEPEGVRGAEHVWTGTQVLALDLPGPSGPTAQETATVARYDPAADAWSASAPSPRQLLPTGGIAGVTAWAGDRLVTWAGGTEDPHACDDVLARGGDCQPVPVPVTCTYDPATDTWRVLRGGPWEQRTGVPGVWTGSALVVTGGRSDWGAGEEPRGPAMPAGRLTLPHRAG